MPPFVDPGPPQVPAAAGTDGLSRTAALDALARAVLHADTIAGVQILTLDESGEDLQIAGSAGFRPRPDFGELLMECRDRGATFRMFEAFDLGEPVVVAGRRDSTVHDPAWEPMHDYLAEVDWDWFASVPVMIRGRAAGLLNAFCTPGQVVGRSTLEFLEAMAEQAAIVVDHASLLRTERERARREERRRLARDLHDSVVQQVFSIGMQMQAMRELSSRGPAVPAGTVRGIAEEVGTLSRTVLADLRAMIHGLRPASSVRSNLTDAVSTLVEGTRNRTGLRFDVHVAPESDGVDPGLADDLFRIIAEAVHNVVKHARAGEVSIRMSIREGTLGLTVADDGRGVASTGSSDRGYGLTTMRERAKRWGGSMRLRSRSGSGTRVRVVVPLPDPPSVRSSGTTPVTAGAPHGRGAPLLRLRQGPGVRVPDVVRHARCSP